MPASKRPTPTPLFHAGLIALGLVSCWSPARAQETGTIRGAVVEDGTWELVGNARVILVASGIATRSGADGTFLISNVPLGRTLVRVEARGFPAVVEEVEVTPGDVPLAVFVQTAVAALEGIIVFGDRRAPGPAGDNKTAADIVADKVPAIRALLARTTESRNAPPTFTIRGRNSFGSAGEPLVIVDGVRMQGGIGSAVRTLREIPARDVASVQVLKGASSAFVYGAADGVILIETVSRATTER